MTAHTLEEARRRLAWQHYHQHLRVLDYRTGRLVPLTPNDTQRAVRRAIIGAEKQGRAARIAVLKARRLGVSTIIQASFAARVFTRPAVTARTGAHDDESSTTLHAMVETMYDHLPPALQPAKRTAITGKRLAFTTGSELRTFTAGGRANVGRSSAARLLHGSEVAFWPDAKATLTAVLQTVPDEPGTIVALESTANGVGDEWHRIWLDAENGASDYSPLFFAWFEMPEYRRPTEPLDEFDAAEQALRLRGVDDQQLAWRRWAIGNLCGGDPDVFRQEYPSHPAEAFLTSGRPFFANLDAYTPREPIRVGRLVGEPVRGGGRVSLEPDPAGPLRIWQVPQADRGYVVFVDPCGGVTLDEYQARGARDGEDYACMQVVDRETGVQVAEWHARMDGDLLGVEAARLGYLYRSAKVAVETTGGYGIAPLAKLSRELSYPDVYRREVLDQTSRKVTHALGWETSSATRPVMLDGLRARLRDAPEGLVSAGLRGEMQTFVVARNGKAQADNGCHDDRVMAMGGALEVWRSCAQRPIRLAPRKVKRPPVTLLGRAPRPSD